MSDDEKKSRIDIDDIDPDEVAEGEALDDDDLDDVSGGINIPRGGRRMAKLAPNKPTMPGSMPDKLDDVMRRW
jgi:hypothetical protein